MSEYVFPAAPQASVPVAGTSARFPVRRIFCVGRNYAAHAREMGGNPDREPPFFFTKPADAVVESGRRVAYPPETKSFHHEVELVVAIGRGGTDVPAEAALGLVFGYAVGIDLTRRDLQLEARDKGRPWDWGKAFDHSAPCSAIHRALQIGHPSSGRIWLAVNGEVKQDADLAELIWPVPDIVAAVSRTMELRPGDLVFTGTPAGVGPLVPGDRVSGGIAGVDEIHIAIGPRRGGA